MIELVQIESFRRCFTMKFGGIHSKNVSGRAHTLFPAWALPPSVPHQPQLQRQFLVVALLDHDQQLPELPEGRAGVLELTVEVRPHVIVEQLQELLQTDVVHHFPHLGRNPCGKGDKKVSMGGWRKCGM